MPPHLHPRSRSTTSLFATTLLASLVVVGVPHVFPCPAPRRTLADSEMTVTADGQQVQRIRRRRRKDTEMLESGGVHPACPATQPADEEVSTFFQMEAEAEKLSQIRRECPVPKPSGLLGPLETDNANSPSIMDLIRLICDVLFNPRHTKWIAPLLVLGDTLLCALVIWKIPYTEIDWETYMQQVSLYISGERDYTLIKGSTGPLVYPAGHVYVYTILHYLTDGGRDILFGQLLFMILYITALGLVLLCYRQAGAPPYVFPLLVLSKRLHSVFVLRLFNDGVAALAMWGAILLFMNRKWTAGVIVWSSGVAVKMTLLLLAPAIAAVTVLSLGLVSSLWLGILAVLVQDPVAYVSRAFELTRQFLFKWTVNWRFVGEELFLSKNFSAGLLVLHISLLAVFVFTAWFKPSGCSFVGFLWDLIRSRQRPVTLPKAFTLTVMLTSLAIGLLCARSLHYQFFAYLAWASPFLLFRARIHPVLVYFVWALQEWAWNVFPSTTASSMAVVFSLAIQVLGVLVNNSSNQNPQRSRDSAKVHTQ